jgi:hypothetical protein
MKFAQAFEIILDLAEQNVLEEKQVDEDPSLRNERTKQLEALKIVKEQACDGEAERYLLILSDMFPGLVNGTTEVNGADLVDRMPVPKYFQRLRRKYPKSKRKK